jgi:hypothetical protein
MSTININTQIGTRELEDFRVAPFQALTWPLTVASGQSIAKRQVVALNSSSKIEVYDSNLSDPLNVAYAISVDDVDATSGDTVAYFWVMGVFNENKLIFADSADTPTQTVKDALRQRGIYLVDSVAN